MSDFESVEAIKQVKYRYLRALDTKNWDEFATTLAEDIVADYGASLGEDHRFTDRASLVDYMRSSLSAGVISEHRVTHPEITMTGPDSASGIWYLQDRVIVPEHSLMLIGAAFYQDRYRRTSDGWKISATGYQRTYEATVSLSDLPSFAVTPGNALHI
ncbi:nuclear transport factor 2 family protein [Mycolicibacterium lutetiense]|uniref:SnoaL-like domain-containing protein n=1 Tax=Mycolicibacterium lutetiense TaxID=1641992 RepID=A0ABS5A2N0_9MYCO|nr:nuclear transport factor 2 family protein [Mycolicibacterium lutetiense]MBP2456000.1 hypothetical protein [Mycolicibacterium lutetiense]